MIIKPIDDKTADLAALQALLARPEVNLTTRQLIENEIKKINSGIKGETDSAYFLNFYFGQSKNWMVINDLRLEYGELSAQIDHLLINRFMEIYVCESKRFSQGVSINEHGEFTVFWNNRPQGIPSPIEQNKRHILLLKKIFDDGHVPLPTRVGLRIKPSLKSLVLVSKEAHIRRPKKAFPWLDFIIKNDQIKTKIDRDMDNDYNVLGIVKVIGQDTLWDFANNLAKFHRPQKFDWAARFGLSQLPPISLSVNATPSAPNTSAVPTPPPPPTEAPVHAAESKTADDVAITPAKSSPKLVCHACGKGIAYNVAKFCWNNKARFGGKTYCFDCQKKI